MSKFDKMVPSETPEVEPAPKPLVIKATGDFTVGLNGCVRKYSKGEIEADYCTAKYLIDTGCPVQPVDGDEFSQCPSCRHIYKR